MGDWTLSIWMPLGGGNKTQVSMTVTQSTGKNNLLIFEQVTVHGRFLWFPSTVKVITLTYSSSGRGIITTASLNCKQQYKLNISGTYANLDACFRLELACNTQSKH